MKYCKKCGCTQPLDQFTKRTSAKDGLQTYCTFHTTLDRKLWGQRNRAKLRAIKYELTPKREAEILELQGGVCGICYKAKKLYIYRSGATAALLCRWCKNWVTKNAGVLKDFP